MQGATLGTGYTAYVIQQSFGIFQEMSIRFHINCKGNPVFCIDCLYLTVKACNIRKSAVIFGNRLFFQEILTLLAGSGRFEGNLGRIKLRI